jgi:diguanylate cyclase (GGDEF)-like protein
MHAIPPLVVFGAAVATAVLTIRTARWDLPALAVLATLVVIGELTSVETASAKLKVSGSYLGMVLAMVLLGGAPAALMAVLGVLIGWLRWHEAGHYLRNNLAAYAWFPLVGGLFFHVVTRTAHVGSDNLNYYLLVFATFLLALVVNFVMVAGYQCWLDGSSLLQKTEEAFVPVLPSQLFSALLTMVAVYLAVQLGVTGLVLFGLVLVVFQYLASELIASKHRSDALHRMATTDELTGLANRERFRARIEQEIKACRQNGEPFAVMLMDLDRFKEINDTLGHDYGDVVLRELGPRLAALIGPGGLVARLGGDEFGVLPATHTDDPRMLEEVAVRLLGCVQLPFAVEEFSLEIGASIGIARFPLDGDDAHTLLRRADIAMYAAKEREVGFGLFSADQDKHSMQRLSTLGEFRRAIDGGELVVHYQPIIELPNDTVHGAEALVRWEHPEQGLILPGEFIQIVEQTGLIALLTRYVLDSAIQECARWRRGVGHACISVNLSVRNLLDRNLPHEIERLLSDHGVPPEALKLEITESMIMSDPDRALATITHLSALGVRFSVDDFGTGYSSLAYLSRLPIDELKIDRSFVSPMLTDASDLIIVRSTINLAHDLGLTIVAEGVEDEPTLRWLAQLGCDRAQGFHIARPMNPAAFASWIDAAHGQSSQRAVA